MLREGKIWLIKFFTMRKHSKSEWKAIRRKSQSCFNYYLWSGMIKNGFIIAATMAAKTKKSLFGASMNWGVNRSQKDVLCHARSFLATKQFVCGNKALRTIVLSEWLSKQEELRFLGKWCGERPAEWLRIWRWPESTWADEGVGARVIMQSLNVSNDEEKIPPTLVAFQDVHTADSAST